MFPGKTRTKSKPCSIGTSFPGNENGILWNFDVPGYLILLPMFSKISTHDAKTILSLCAIGQSINGFGSVPPDLSDSTSLSLPFCLNGAAGISSL